ncbi:NAD(P)-binding protein [Podospora conica]|nr:NAD(P)-binding protein [Schizothecium conicum]
MSLPKYTSKLSSRRVLVLGGTSGVGFCVAEAALEHGATVIISSSNPTKIANALVRLNPASALPVTGTPCDLGSPDTVEANIKALLDFATDSGRHPLDHVVFTAGDPLDAPRIEDATPANAMKLFQVRFLGAVMLAKALSGFIKKDAGSSVTFTGGTNTDRPMPGWALVAGVGAAVEGLTRGLAGDMRPVRFNVVSLGAVHTELWGSMAGEGLEGFVEACRRGTLTGEVGRPEDVAEAYLYCMKDRFVTGEVIKTNGGRMLV